VVVQCLNPVLTRGDQGVAVADVMLPLRALIPGNESCFINSIHPAGHQLSETAKHPYRRALRFGLFLSSFGLSSPRHCTSLFWDIHWGSLSSWFAHPFTVPPRLPPDHLYVPITTVPYEAFPDRVCLGGGFFFRSVIFPVRILMILHFFSTFFSNDLKLFFPCLFFIIFHLFQRSLSHRGHAIDWMIL